MIKVNRLIWLLVIICPSLWGCGAKTMPPLTEGEIPWQMKPGIYVDAKNQTHEVSTNRPRWSVSEEYLYEAVTTVEPIKPKLIDKVSNIATDNMKTLVYGLIFFITSLIFAVVSRKFKKADK